MQDNMFKSIGPQSFLLPCPIFLVGTYTQNNYDKSLEERKPNLMTVAWATLCSAQPPSLLVAIRSSRHTHNAILENKAFTVNLPDTSLLKEVDYAGIFSAANLNDTDSEDKFTQCNFTALAGEHVDAPYVKECPVVIELKLLTHHVVGTHTLFIGEIMDTKIKESLFNVTNPSVPDIKKLDIPCYIPMLREYWSIGDFKAKAFSVGKTMLTKK